MEGKARRVLSLVLSIGLLFQQTSFAQIAAELNIGGYLSRPNTDLAQDKFRPLALQYFSYDSLNDSFKVLLDKGDVKQLDNLKAQEQTKTLLSYFLIGITLPDDAFWVNLRPDSEDQIIDQYLEQTDIGKVMLEADLQLKKDTASFTSPQTPEGKEYWNKLYKKAAALYGNDNVTIPTLTRPWIVPGEIIIRESKDSAYVYKATLKIMLEQDYLKDSATYNFKDERAKELNDYSSQLIRELIIPKLDKEVNSSKRYANLRQVYHSLILARWFKLRFAGKPGSYASLINTKKLTNLVSRESWSKTTYFKEYQKSFTKGEYNIQEPVSTPTGQLIRSYFSGGEDLTGKTMAMPTASNLLADGEIGVFSGNPAPPSIPGSIAMVGKGSDPLNVNLEAQIKKLGDYGAMGGSGMQPQEAGSWLGSLPGDVQGELNSIMQQFQKWQALDYGKRPEEYFTLIKRIKNPSADDRVGIILSRIMAILAVRMYQNDPEDVTYLTQRQTTVHFFDYFWNRFYHAFSAATESKALVFKDVSTTGTSDSARGHTISLGSKEVMVDVLNGYPPYSSEDIALIRRFESILYLPAFIRAEVEAINSGMAASKPAAKSGATKPGKSPQDTLKLITTYMPLDEVISAPKLYDLYLAHYQEMGFEMPAKRDSALRTIERDLFESENSLLAIGVVKELPEKGKNGTRQFVLVAPEARTAMNEQVEPVAAPLTTVPAQESASPARKGGIDFRTLPMTIQPMGNFSDLNFQLPQLSKAVLEQININAEMQQIRNMVQSGIIPSGERIKELIAACIQKKEINSQVDNLLLCLVDIFKLEEEEASESSPELREALVIIDLQS